MRRAATVPLIPFGLLLSLSLSSSACNWRLPARGPLRSAAAVQAERAAGAQVELVGAVRQQAPFVGGGAYQLADDSGQVWVVTAQTLPAVGDRLKILGEVDYRSIPANGQEWGGAFIREIERQPVAP